MLGSIIGVALYLWVISKAPAGYSQEDDDDDSKRIKLEREQELWVPGSNSRYSQTLGGSAGFGSGRPPH